MTDSFLFPQAMSEPEGTVSILVVDDDPCIREMLKDFLLVEGFDVDVQPSGELAVASLVDRPRDIVLTDLLMPGMGGLQVLARVKELRPETEVIVITGYATVQNGIEAMRQGAYDFLFKPVKLDQIEAVLNRCARWIRHRRSHEELQVVHRKLEELTRLKRRFLAVADHELRTPVTVLDGMLQLLTARLDPLSEDLKERLDTARGVSKRLVEIVRDIHNLVRLEGGGLPVQLDTGTVTQIVRGLRVDLDLVRAERILELTLDNRVSDDRFFTADMGRIRQAVGELVANAAKATPDGGRIAIVLEIDDGAAPPRFEATVTDSGPGVPEPERERIFELFHHTGNEQNHHTARYDHGGAGLGLGLPLARQIAHAHAGGLDLHHPPQGGAAFTLWFPLSGAS